MRKPILITLLFFMITHGPSYAQGCIFNEDYASDADWTYFYNYYPETAPCVSASQSGTLSFTGGAFSFDNIKDGSDTRYYHDLGVDMYDDFWTVSFEVTPTAGAPTDKTGVVLLALTEGNDNPINDSYSICDTLNTDALMVMWMSDDPADPLNVGFELWANDNGVITKSSRVHFDYGSTYYLQFSRIATEYMLLDIYADADHEEDIGTVPCFIIPTTITGLNTIQHGNYAGGNPARKFTGTIDNTCVRNLIIEPLHIDGPTSLCLGDTSSYTVTTLPASDIEWIVPAGVVYTGAGTTTISVSDWPGGGTFEIDCAISINCYYDTAHYTVTIIDPAEPLLIEDGFCEGGNTTVDVTIPDATYTWYDGETTATHYFDEAGTYWVDIVSSGCSLSDTIIISEYANPEFSLGNDDSICGAYVIDAGPGFESYNWSTGATTQTITTSLLGIYSVTVADEHGCEAMDEIELFNSCDDHLNLPNVFSPNEDGINDQLKPLYYGPIKNYSLKIWNRYGELVFETDNLEKGWNGKYENEDQPMGTYVFTMDAKLDEKALHKTGNITLVR